MRSVIIVPHDVTVPDNIVMIVDMLVYDIVFVDHIMVVFDDALMMNNLPVF